MREALILHYGYKDLNRDSVAYIENASREEIDLLHNRLVGIVRDKVLRK